MEKCYEYFDCKLTDCFLYKNENLNCWDYSDKTLCNNHNFEEYIEIKCSVCIHYIKHHGNNKKNSVF